MNKKLDILIESSHAAHTHTRTQFDDALRTSENDDDEESISEEDDDAKNEDDKGDDDHEDGTDDDDDDDDDDLDEAGLGVGQDEAAFGDDRNDEGVVVAKVVSKDNDTDKVDSSSKNVNIADAKKSDHFKPLAEVNRSEQHQIDGEKIDVDATIATVVNAGDNLIVSSNLVSGFAEISKKNNLEMRLLFYVRRRGIGRKEHTTINVYCKGKNTIFPPFRSGIEEVSTKIGLRNESKFSTIEPFPIVAIDGLPEQVTSDCGVFVASFAEYFIDGEPFPSSNFDVEVHRDRLAVSFYHYGMKKQLENIESESEAPPSLPKK
ncbi:hypothetical protein G4B88_021839 [Cannabis sativa]|uniref:Ubiquitin-like protease family profile domain-containing protein n=1 Tax=Cannabis sativa TaxID=3483 RepID=A0A7J6GYZ4_CANSA|nr:hypothetical protein G4B88_021839 [Cannabis sativa]